MAPPLKDFVDGALVRRIAADIQRVHPPFETDRFVRLATAGLDALELKDRGAHIADALQATLPQPYSEAARVLIASLGPVDDARDQGMAALGYMAHDAWIARYGLDDFETSTWAQERLTQRFTCEFSIRFFIQRYPDRIWKQLHTWAKSDNEHVRRLASEGTRPRLPWAPQLRELREDPGPVLELLEVLKDDPARYVQRSVANNLNDISKDHPDRVIDTCRRWMSSGGDDVEWIVRHALRTLIKAGSPGALRVLGYAAHPALEVVGVNVPESASIGDTLRFSFGLRSTSAAPQPLLVDYVVHFVKADGKTRPKVFKLKQVELAAGERLELKHRVSLKQHSTRTHDPGVHRIEVRINGVDHPLASFDLRGSRS